jgi:transposase
MDQRDAFLAEQRRGLYTMQELCERYAIGRKTGDKWVARIAEEGSAGLQDRSRARHSCPHKTSEKVAALIVAARRAHPSREPEQLRGPTLAASPGYYTDGRGRRSSHGTSA